MTWDKVATTIKENGEKTIRCKSAGSRCMSESRKEAIPHANRSGVWFRTTYFLMKPDGTEKEYFTLKAAKEAAEEEKKA
jgi:hypothetical protein